MATWLGTSQLQTFRHISRKLLTLKQQNKETVLGSKALLWGAMPPKKTSWQLSASGCGDAPGDKGRT